MVHSRGGGILNLNAAALTFVQPQIIKKGEPLRLRYALYVHSGVALPEKIEAQWKAFAATPA